MIHNVRFTYIHSSPKEMQSSRICVSFVEECTRKLTKLNISHFTVFVIIITWFVNIPFYCQNWVTAKNGPRWTGSSLGLVHDENSPYCTIGSLRGFPPMRTKWHTSLPVLCASTVSPSEKTIVWWAFPSFWLDEGPRNINKSYFTQSQKSFKTLKVQIES